MSIKRTLLALVLILTCWIVVPQSNVAAYSFFGGTKVDCGNQDYSSSAVCNSKSTGSDPLTGPNGTLTGIANVVAYVTGAAAIIIMIISGFRYITSGGDSNKVSSAKSGFINALVGLVIIVLAKTLIVYVLSNI